MSKLIAIDIGHGKDTYPPSKGVPGMAEFEFNNAVGKYAKPMLERNGFRVLYTQPPDSTDVGLNRRTTLANQRGVDLFLSIHADWNNNSSARGAWSFYWHTSEQAKKMAGIWLRQLTHVTPIQERQIMPSEPGEWTNFHVLRETRMTAVLMEHGFMSNEQDLKMLQSDSYRKKSAEALTRAVCEFYGVTYQEEEKTPQTSTQEVETVDYKQDEKPSEWAEDAVKWGKEKGITDGTYLKRPATREELITILYRIEKDS